MFRFLVALAVVLGAVHWPHRAQNSPAQELTGVLDYRFIDSPESDEVVWSMVADGKRITLDIPYQILVSAGGLPNLAGREVKVRGRGSEDDFAVQSIGWLPAKSVTTAVAKPMTAEKRPQVVILAKFKDISSTPHPRSWYVSLFSGTAPSVQDYFLEQSNGKWDLSGDQVVNWVTLPKNHDDYLTSTGSHTDDEAVFRDAVAVADPQVDFTKFDGIHVLVNANVGEIGGSGGRVTYTLDGQTRQWGRTMENPGDWILALLAHEIGHSFGFDHSSGPYDTPYDSGWDQMSRTGNVGRFTAEFGAFPQHTNAYHRLVGGITDPSKIAEILPGTTRTYHLSRTVQPVDGSYHALRIFLGEGSHWLTVESRLRTGLYEQGATLTDEGVILHDCNPAHLQPEFYTGVIQQGPVSEVVDVDQNGDPNDDAAVWKPGETYQDVANGVTVKVIKQTATGFDVRVTVDGNQPPPYVVTNGNDSGAHSLRGAIAYANLVPGTTISFAAPPESLTNGELLIQPITPLPELTAPGTTIDGTTQTALGNSNGAMPEVAVDGGQLSGWGYGLSCRAAKSHVIGLTVRNMPSGGIYLGGAKLSTIENCVCGLDRTGTVPAPNGWTGIVADTGSDSLTLRGDICSGNASAGAFMTGLKTIKILGGAYGTNVGATASVGNIYDGLHIEKSQMITVGLDGARHPIFSGSVQGNGAVFDHCTGVDISKAYCGIDAKGTTGLGNSGSGMWFGNCKAVSVSNTILSGNQGNGLVIDGGQTLDFSVTDSTMGLNAAGNAAIPNTGNGAYAPAPNVTFTGCLASGNLGNGISLAGDQPKVVNCKTGTNRAGTVAIGNTYLGVSVGGASNFLVDHCYSSGNGTGIGVGAGAHDGVIRNCIVGTGVGGQVLGNAGTGIGTWEGSSKIKITDNTVSTAGGGGISITDSSNVDISGGSVKDCGGMGVGFWDGAASSTVENVAISGCKYSGLGITGPKTKQISIHGVVSDGNDWAGLQIWDGANHCTIDTCTFINYTGAGISMQTHAHHNSVTSCYIGCLSADPSTPIHNGWTAIGIWQGAHDNVIGTPTAGNVLAGGAQNGINVTDDATVGNTFRGNAMWMTARLGIDLGSDGPDSNDNSDNDGGPNRKQNYPVLSRIDGQNHKVAVSYRGLANRKLIIDLYSVDPGRDSGAGPGFAWVGSSTITTDGTGRASFSMSTGSAERVTAVATDQTTGDSSEFATNLSLP